MPEARLDNSGSGLAPASDAGFVVNVRDAMVDVGHVETALLAWGALVLSPGGSPRPAVQGPSDDPLVDWWLPFEGSV